MVTLESTRTYLHTNLTLLLDPVLTSSLEKRAAIFLIFKALKNFKQRLCRPHFSFFFLLLSKNQQL
ncbi:MAG: hypothetical protein PG977_000018 [Bartonella clarridgeiae]|nr:MAG: hypothetical protein PG977_000001 [Bartonella clarridgeiae]WCR54625.1 MAG: hypothetical protein PG977_000018 [Bartonella clarridgeiae]